MNQERETATIHWYISGALILRCLRFRRSPFQGSENFQYRYHFWLFLLGAYLTKSIAGSAQQLLVVACKCASDHARDSRRDKVLMTGGVHGLSSHAFRWDKTEVPTPE
jgi:hypothetical protein